MVKTSYLSAFAVTLSGAVLLSACTKSGEAVVEPTATQQAETTALSCDGLASLQLENTVIQSAELMAAGSFQPPPSTGPGSRPADYSSLPEFCRVTGSIKPTEASDIQFEAWLPLTESWNGHFMQVGNGGAAGSLLYSSMVEPLKRGYAVVHTDTGHKGATGDFSWALGEPEKLTDYQYRAVRELTLTGKAITTTRYGEAPDKAFWYGCSTGGRQGLLEAQRYPEDYDAIVAGAPANNWEPLQLLSVHITKNLGPGGFPVQKLGLLKQAAIAACDGEDGLEDGVIADPEGCKFNPQDLVCEAGADAKSCLSQSEAAAANRVYAGVTLSDGSVVFPGTGFGSEPAWAAYSTPFFQIGTSYLRNVVFEDPDWDPATLDVDADLARTIEVEQGATAAMDPDLSAFAANGGKLLLYHDHGLADGIISYGNTMNYYESILETMDASTVEGSIQFFTVPGMGHCSGGDGASEIDWLTAMEDWVETGEKPEQLVATKSGETGYTRPVCTYPNIVTYSGEGDETDAANFTCEAP
ncbi:MAG: tannase/feruloyl esterase family alpha/beta hydrolase [Ponticaulis sp.]|nr:tannase/feruloyl esterase family alpha/beta hydrolase [Ponticaulis sp.]|tara:strand:+ start:28284 stop:29861 length:1578 start_codon:yes stop_codon:yes gene_type:complete